MKVAAIQMVSGVDLSANLAEAKVLLQSAAQGGAQGGLHDNQRRTWGHAMLVDPWGKVLAERAQDGPGVVMAELSWDLMQQCRSRLPALEHRLL